MNLDGGKLIVAQLIETLGTGGAEILAVDIANDLAVRGIESHLIVIDGGGPSQLRVLDSVKLHDLQSPRCLGSIMSRAFYFRRIHRTLGQIIDANKIKVVQSHLPKANFFGLTLAFFRQLQVHPTVHNNREFEYGDHRNYVLEKGRRVAYRSMLNVCGEMIAVSPEVKSSLATELGVAGSGREQKIVAISNGVVCGEPMSHDDRTVVRRSWEIGDIETLIVAAGRLTAQKNFSSLIESLSELPPDIPPWKCIIAGDGELRDSLADQILKLGLSDRVKLPGHVAKIRNLMDAADIFCLSSDFEGLPLVMLEAMSSGLPVCAFRIRGVVDVVTHQEQGLLAEQLNKSEFAMMLTELICDPRRRSEMGRKARVLVQECYSFEYMVDRLVSLYRGNSYTQSS